MIYKQYSEFQRSTGSGSVDDKKKAVTDGVWYSEPWRASFAPSFFTAPSPTYTEPGRELDLES
jgi:hypothetical protein